MVTRTRAYLVQHTAYIYQVWKKPGGKHARESVEHKIMMLFVEMACAQTIAMMSCVQGFEKPTVLIPDPSYLLFSPVLLVHACPSFVRKHDGPRQVIQLPWANTLFSGDLLRSPGQDLSWLGTREREKESTRMVFQPLLLSVPRMYMDGSDMMI